MLKHLLGHLKQFWQTMNILTGAHGSLACFRLHVGEQYDALFYKDDKTTAEQPKENADRSFHF